MKTIEQKDRRTIMSYKVEKIQGLSVQDLKDVGIPDATIIEVILYTDGSSEQNIYTIIDGKKI